MQNLEAIYTAKEMSVIDRAKYIYQSDDIYIPDDAHVTVTTGGYWVSAEVFVYED